MKSFFLIYFYLDNIIYFKGIMPLCSKKKCLFSYCKRSPNYFGGLDFKISKKHYFIRKSLFLAFSFARLIYLFYDLLKYLLDLFLNKVQ